MTYEHPEIETLERPALEALQDRKLRALGARLSRDAGWNEHFASFGMKPGDLSRETLARVGTLEKSVLRARYPFPFLTVDMPEVARFCATSGTTGLPVMFGYTQRDVRELMPFQMKRLLRAAGVEPGERVYQGYGYGLWVGGVVMDWALLAYGCTNFGIGPGRADAVVQWLRDHAYTSCTMSPLWLMTLVNAAKAQGIEPKRDWTLRLGVFGGQSVSAAFRNELEAAMPEGFVAQNIYGSTESGGPNHAISCRFSHDADEMHLINEDTILTEIVDPQTLEPVAPGETGEIVFTTLDREASPVVRWRTRDLVRLSDDPFGCGCGRRAFPLIGRIIGRTDDMLKVRGTMVFPSQVEDCIASLDATVNEAWQIYIDREDRVLDRMVVAVERRPDATMSGDDVRDALERTIRARLGIRVAIEVQPEGSLPRYEAKAVRVIVRSPSKPS
ncbi:MAG: AMP-binding protein [Candidatus Eremiobacteraeota bacterium]|nr:AMP-binding protein [Candidatus Eremiobacteraeota bacterium]